ncbi:MAG TPA: hypothetical protein VFM18_18760 [Methanosarcina sp.]|nr:hypothetical protein [Methanosarcina sp.]
MRNLLVDTSNTFFRARHVVHRQSSPEEKVAYALHITMSSIAKCWREQNADHVVIALEGRSWRKDFYAPYKKNREIAKAALTEKELEEDKLFWEAYGNLVTFLKEKTNCTVLHHPELEADDLIGGWIQSHPTYHHTIVSSDTDFDQLIAENVNRYNGITDELVTLTGFYNGKGKQVVDKKTKLPKVLDDPKYILFEKCMRGDPTDNVFSAYPGVRSKSTKNKTGLIEAFADKEKKGFAWNNLMLQRWTDHNDVEHKVLDDYNRNVTLVDLTAQPDDIKIKIAETIANNSTALSRPMIGAQFLKFCGKYDLVKMSEHADSFIKFLEASYIEKE